MRSAVGVKAREEVPSIAIAEEGGSGLQFLINTRARRPLESFSTKALRSNRRFEHLRVLGHLLRRRAARESEPRRTNRRAVALASARATSGTVNPRQGMSDEVITIVAGAGPRRRHTPQRRNHRTMLMGRRREDPANHPVIQGRQLGSEALPTPGPVPCTMHQYKCGHRALIRRSTKVGYNVGR